MGTASTRLNIRGWLSGWRDQCGPIQDFAGGQSDSDTDAIQVGNNLVFHDDGNCGAFLTDSSEKIVGGVGFGQLANCVIEGEFEDAVGAESVGSSHSDFSLVVQALDDAAGK